MDQIDPQRSVNLSSGSNSTIQGPDQSDKLLAECNELNAKGEHNGLPGKENKHGSPIQEPLQDVAGFRVEVLGGKQMQQLSTIEKLSSQLGELLQKVQAYEKEMHELNTENSQIKRENQKLKDQLEQNKVTKEEHQQTPRNQETIDVAILYSSALAEKDECGSIKALTQKQTLNPEPMLDEILRNLGDQKRQYHILMRHLNRKTFSQIVNQETRILIIDCHGAYQAKATKKTNFLFENVEQPAIVDCLTEEELHSLLRGVKLDKVRLVVASSCYSGQLADIFVKAGVKSVVAIDTRYQVSEAAASKFNIEFINNLTAGKTIKDAFEEARRLVGHQKENQSCCCNHNHKPTCLWKKLQDEDKNKAHQLHSPPKQSCTCFYSPSINFNEHKGGCKVYQNFYKTLKAKQNEEKTRNEQSGGNNGLLPKEPILRFTDPGQNFMCCCSPDELHNESNKFLLMGKQENHQETLDLETKEGVLRRHKWDSSLEYMQYSWLEFNNSQRYLYERNLQVYQIVDFISHREQKLLCVIGPDRCGKSILIRKAIKFCIVRKCSPPLFSVKLEKVDSFNTALEKISEALRDKTSAQATEQSLLNLLAHQNCLIYFDKCEYLEKGQQELFGLFKKIIQYTVGVKIIVGVTELLNQVKNDLDDKKYKLLQIKDLEPELRYEFFKSKIFEQKKQGQEKVYLDQISPQAFKDINLYYVEKLARKIEKTSDFQQLLKELLQEQRTEEKRQQDEIERLMVNITKEHNFKAPRRARSSNHAEATPRIPLEVAQRTSESFSGEKNMILLLTLTPGGLTKDEVKQLCRNQQAWFGDYKAFEKAFNNFQNLHEVNQQDTFGKLVRCDPLRDIEGESLIQIKPAAIKTIVKHFNSLISLQTKVKEVERQELVSVVIEFMSSKASQILRQIDQSDHRLITAHLDCDMWQYQLNEDESFSEIIYLPEKRMSNYLASNFQHIMDESFLNEHIQGWISNNDRIKLQISDLCLSIPSILIELKRLPDAEQLIVRCQKFSDKINPLLDSRLKLMYASILTFTATNPCEEQINSQIVLLLETAREKFRQLEPCGEAETYFVQALHDINKLEYEINFQQNGAQGNQSNNSDPPALTKQISVQNIASQQSQQLLKDLVANLSIESFVKRTDSCSKVIESLEKSLKLFSEVKKSKACSQVCGVAKVLLTETLFFVTFSEIIQPSQGDLELYLSKAAEMEKLFMKQADYNYVAQSICLQAKVHLMTTGNQSQPSRVKVLEARSTLKRAFDILTKVGNGKIRDDLRKTQEDVVNAIRNSSSNLFTFAKSFPLVMENSTQDSDIGDYAVSKFQLAPKIREYFAKKEVEVQVIFDFLNEELLRNVAEHGTKILHLTSDQHNPDYLVLEDQNGLIKLQEIKPFFEKILKENSRLEIQCVVLAMPQSSKLGEQFKELGVNNVVTFDLEGNFDQNLHTYRYNFIYQFCAHFYKNLVDEYTVEDAFNCACQLVLSGGSEDSINRSLKKKDIKYGSYGIKPVLLGDGTENQLNKRKLFDRNAQPGDFNFLGSGQMQEIFTKSRCLNTNIEKPKDAFIGHHGELHRALKHLTCMNEESLDFRHLVHVQYKNFVGKTRLLHEAAYRLLQRGFFQFKIHYRDMKQLSKFSDLVVELSNRYSGRKVNELKAVQILLVLDNIDCLLPEEKQDYERNLNILINLNPGIRFLTSSTRPWKFKLLKSERDQYKENDQKLGRFEIIKLQPLTEIQAVNLLLSKCKRKITREELQMTEEDSETVQQRLQKEKSVQKCMGLPGYLVKLAEFLSRMKVSEIEVQDQPSKNKVKFRRKQSRQDSSSIGELLFDVDVPPKYWKSQNQVQRDDTGQDSKTKTMYKSDSKDLDLIADKFEMKHYQSNTVKKQKSQKQRKSKKLYEQSGLISHSVSLNSQSFSQSQKQQYQQEEEVKEEKVEDQSEEGQFEDYDEEWQ